MGRNCCVPLCKNRFQKGNAQNISWHSFPVQDKARTRGWLIKIRRELGKEFRLTADMKVCSAHFTASDFKPLLHSKKRILKADAVPSVFPWSENLKESQQAIRLENRNRKILQSIENVPVNQTLEAGVSLTCEANVSLACEVDVSSACEADVSSACEADVSLACEALLSLSETQLVHPQTAKGTNEFMDHRVCTGITDSRPNNSTTAKIQTFDDTIIKENETLKEIVKSLQSKIISLEVSLQTRKQKIQYLESKEFSLSNVAKMPDLFSSYTGLPSYQVFLGLYEYLKPKAERLVYWPKTTCLRKSDGSIRGRSRQLSSKEELFMVLVRLRLGAPRFEVARLFGTSTTFATRTFITWINFLSVELKAMFCLPDRSTIKQALPESFHNYPNTTLIIDCTEIRMERPSSVQSQRETFSTYKHYNTCKILVGVTPGGLLTFVSKVFGGGCSDQHITKQSGLYDLLLPGDELMADKGFDIKSDLPPGVKLNVPPKFMAKRDPQMPVEDVYQTRRIASVRVHVERAIRRMKSFRILHGCLPISIAQSANEIISVCAFLTNLQKALIKIKKNK